MARLPRNDKELNMLIMEDVEKGLKNALPDFTRNLEMSFAAVNIPSINATMYDTLGIAYQPEGGLTDVEGVWEPQVQGGQTPELSLEYNQDKLDIGGYYANRHNSPIGTPLGNFADLIREGAGGKLFGEDNPTREARDFWEYYIHILDTHWEGWVKSGFRQAGMREW